MPTREAIVLASASPRRAALLAQIGVDVEVVPSLVVERPLRGETPSDYIIRIARAKVVAVAKSRDRGLVLGADTVVVLDGQMLGKPTSEAEAAQMLRLLSGRWHAVMTAVALYDASNHKEAADFDKTLVRFAKMSDREVDWYVSTGEPMDKAGAYGIQGLGGLFVDEIAGNYYNVVGLPIPLVYRLARQLNFFLIGEA